MTGIHDEPVDVVRRGDTPAQFLLRDRLYVVRGVLAHWVEPGGWRWAGPAAQPEPDGELALAAAVGARSAGSGPVTAPGTAEPAAREVWRVEAAPGRSGRRDVFDLCRAREQPRWTATRMEEAEQT